jgi:hypothetical protein
MARLYERSKLATLDGQFTSIVLLRVRFTHTAQDKEEGTWLCLQLGHMFTLCEQHMRAVEQIRAV